MGEKYIVTRDVTSKECPWLLEAVLKGTILTLFTGCTYGCVTDLGSPYLITGIEGFVELPNDAVNSL